LSTNQTRRITPAGFSWRPVLNLRAVRTPHLNCGIAGTLMRGGGGAATVGSAVLLLGLANILAVPICEPSAAFGRLPPIPAAPPPRPPPPPPPLANEAVGEAKTTRNTKATFTDVFDMGSSTICSLNAPSRGADVGSQSIDISWFTPICFIRTMRGESAGSRRRVFLAVKCRDDLVCRHWFKRECGQWRQVL
jgi:hypothetical protein